MTLMKPKPFVNGDTEVDTGRRFLWNLSPKNLLHFWLENCDGRYCISRRFI